MHIDPAYPWRREKRHQRKWGGATHDAYFMGEMARHNELRGWAIPKRWRSNPFPVGSIRHQAYEQGRLDA
jgi:hypothetical protein